ncbi:unnamed protein product [Moneuplotes crassus]|uniref:Transmembrane protein n=1 Tax=Euplotes crassus TaxID=5936 RepID=A0AAD1UR06_EUPCR|nr:unnamed protein product [Moneuplotes crassus]
MSSKWVGTQKTSLKEKVADYFGYKLKGSVVGKNIVAPGLTGISTSRCGIGLALFLGLSAKKYSGKNDEYCKSRFTQSKFESLSLDTNESYEDTVSKVGQTVRRSQADSIGEDTIEEKDYLSYYLSPISKINKENYGTYTQRCSPIFKKIKYNPRMVDSADLNSFDKIIKGQNKYGLGMTILLGLFPVSMYSKSLTISSKNKIFAFGIMCLVLNMAVLTYYNTKFKSFLEHLDKKYFYGQTLEELQDDSFKKINQPKAISFHTHPQPLEVRIQKLKAWKMLNRVD